MILSLFFWKRFLLVEIDGGSSPGKLRLSDSSAKMVEVISYNNMNLMIKFVTPRAIVAAMIFLFGHAHADESAPTHYWSPMHTCSWPTYPASAPQKKIKIKILVKLLILTDGTVAQARITESSGIRILDKVTLESLVRCKHELRGEEKPDGPVWEKTVYVWDID